MTNAELLAKIKAEIGKKVLEAPINAEGHQRVWAYNDVIDLLSTLESEKPMNFDFNYEFSHFLDKKDEELGFTTWSEEDLQELARHFYELGCRCTAEKYDELEYNRQRAEVSEKPMNLEGLEKEIEEYFPESTFNTGFNYDDLQEIARHFAQWGATHAKDESENPASNNAEKAAKEYARYHYADTFSQELAENDFLAGSAWKEMLMLKEAVEGFIFQSEDYYPKELVARYDGELKHGDKVRVIIVKEDKA